ncbi:protein YELLOW LEAF 1, choloroplastic-like [Nicotiana tomentosiformis]|uniref:protein YELLOW LEAF 1, choloroplastic-like n=1 Tax=Nicotiana tomentosiformis TaxID=4098 RepID=UPI00388C7F7D
MGIRTSSLIYIDVLDAAAAITTACIQFLNARCATEGQTQTLTRENSTITVAPGKVKSPDLDGGGAGFTPRDDGGGMGGCGGGGWGGGGGGGGHWAGGGGGVHWAGGFFLFVFLVILGFLKDKEEEGPYGDQRRRRPAY